MTPPALTPCEPCGQPSDCAASGSCFGEKARSISVSPAATPNRRNNVPSKRGNNSWERGVATDARGMPIRKANGDVIPVKEYASNRGRYDQLLKEARSGQVPAGT